MINDDFAKYCLERINEIYLSTDLNDRQKILAAFKVFKDFFIKFDEENLQIFSSFYQRIIYIIKKYSFDNKLAKRIHFVRYIANQARHHNDKIIQSHFFTYFANLFLIFHFVAKQKLVFPDIELANFTNIELISDEHNKTLPYTKSSTRAYVKSVESHKESDHCLLTLENDDGIIFKVKLNHHWQLLASELSENTTLHLHNLSQNGDIFETNSYSLVVFEPDYLIDVTDISECFSQQDFNPFLYFIKKISERITNRAILKGNIVNSLFDELILDENANYQDCFQKALKNKPIQSVAAVRSIDELKELYYELLNSFEVIRQNVQKISLERAYIEPSFIAPEYGISGRLDLLAENAKELFAVELKSGKSPNSNLSYIDYDKSYSLAIWKNHVVQAICYIMLLEANLSNKSVFASILYIAAAQNHLRNVPNSLLLKQQIIRCRNAIAVFLKRIADDSDNQIQKIFQDTEYSSNLPSYISADFELYRRLYNSSSKLEQKLIAKTIGFIAQLSFHNKIGDDLSSTSVSSQWLESVEEKIEKGTIIANLSLLPEKSDFTRMHLTFLQNNINSKINVIRKGDLCLLKKQNPELSPGNNNQVLKGIISSISNSEITISLINKLINYNFDANHKWIIEQEQSDTISGYLYSSVFSLLRCSAQKRQLLLGLTKPQSSTQPAIQYPELIDEQNELLSKIIAASDYFLVQGPPGVGKTSYLLRYLVKYYFENTNSNILLVAYTNRAVDEICLTLKKISPDFPFLRLGNKESTEIQENSIAALAEKMRFSDLFLKIKSCRVFVSTISSVLTSNELFQIKNFDIAIVDEASQILEVYIYSLVSQVKKFVLIGDEKQLPAVVPLQNGRAKIKDDDLSQIEMCDLSVSYFERLLKIAQKNNWQDFYGMLSYQSRMKQPIMELANFLFYENKLKLSRFVQSNSAEPQFCDDFDFLNASDIIFINTPKTRTSKTNTIEAEIASNIAKSMARKLGNRLDNSDIGIIVAFRLQGNEIFKNLGELSQIIDVDTVERFQGSERRTIIISFAVNRPIDIELISNVTSFNGSIVDRKLNVAITRAKEKLIIIGNARVLMHSPVYFKLINYIKEKHLFVDYEKILSDGGNHQP
ncbi:MAG: ATP-dependent helicase [Bacteroidota bacterium]